MTKQKLWELIEAYRMSGGSEEHHARKEQLDAVLDGLLAQHDSGQAKPEPEPVAWMYVNTDGECEQIEYGKPYDDPSVTPLYTTPPQPQQEPVAWLIIHKSTKERFLSTQPNNWNSSDWFKQPLYTTPPQREWVGLTDEQIDAEHDRLFPKPAFNFDRQNVRNFARAIEAAHGIKG